MTVNTLQSTATLRGVLLLAAALSGCAKEGTVSLAEGPRNYSASDYSASLKMWTREAQLLSVDEMDNVLTVTSTFESWDFRAAHSERYARDYRLTPAQKAQHQARSLAESKNYHHFYVALFAQHPKWGDLQTDEPAWIVRLVDSSGTESEPAEIHRIKKPGPMELNYYPYTGSFRTVYRISFPTKTESGKPTLSPQSEWFALRFAGAQGTADVRWLVE